MAVPLARDDRAQSAWPSRNVAWRSQVGHWIVGPEPELLAVRLRRELVPDVEMASKNFLRLAADQADEVVIVDRPARRDSGLRFGRRRLADLSTEGLERAANRTDQIPQIGHGDGVPGEVGDHDLRREIRNRPQLLLLLFFGTLRHEFPSA